MTEFQTNEAKLLFAVAVIVDTVKPAIPTMITSKLEGPDKRIL